MLLACVGTGRIVLFKYLVVACIVYATLTPNVDILYNIMLLSMLSSFGFLVRRSRAVLGNKSCVHKSSEVCLIDRLTTEGSRHLHSIYSCIHSK